MASLFGGRAGRHQLIFGPAHVSFSYPCMNVPRFFLPTNLQDNCHPCRQTHLSDNRETSGKNLGRKRFLPRLIFFRRIVKRQMCKKSPGPFLAKMAIGTKSIESNNGSNYICSMFNFKSIEAKARVFEFIFQKMNTFELT